LSNTTLERKLTAWNDPDREGAWRLFTLCRGCAEVKFCRGKERDRVVCRECFLSDATVVPFFELGLWDYSDAAGAKREHARGLALLEERKRQAEENRQHNLEQSRKRRQLEREARDREIALLVSEGHSYETVAERFGLKPATIAKLAGGSRKSARQTRMVTWQKMQTYLHLWATPCPYPPQSRKAASLQVPRHLERSAAGPSNSGRSVGVTQ